MIKRAAEALSKRLGGKTEETAELLQEDVQHWKNPSHYNISVAPALLHGIEQPEMIIIRGRIKTAQKELDGLIVVVDDEDSSQRLIETLSQLEMVIIFINVNSSTPGGK